MEKLKARGIVHVHQIHVEIEELVRVGDIFGIGDFFDIPRRAVESVPQRPYARGDLLNLLTGIGDILDEDNTQ